MYFVNQGKVLNDRKTIEENSVETGTTIEMSLRKNRRDEKRRADGNVRDRRHKEKEAESNEWKQAVGTQR